MSSELSGTQLKVRCSIVKSHIEHFDVSFNDTTAELIERCRINNLLMTLQLSGDLENSFFYVVTINYLQLEITHVPLASHAIILIAMCPTAVYNWDSMAIDTTTTSDEE